jgi:hypothetical protein
MRAASLYWVEGRTRSCLIAMMGYCSPGQPTRPRYCGTISGCLICGLHRPRLRRNRPTPSNSLSRTAGISSTPPTSVRYRPDSLNHPLHRSSEYLRAAGLPETCQLESMSLAGCVRLAGWGGAHPRHRHAHRRLGWLSPEHSRPVQLVPAERQSGHRRRTYGVRLQPPALDVLACR